MSMYDPPLPQPNQSDSSRATDHMGKEVVSATGFSETWIVPVGEGVVPRQNGQGFRFPAAVSKNGVI